MTNHDIAFVELVVLIISSFLVILQIILLRKQMKDSHEEHRRENTSNIMFMWCNSLKKDTCIAEQVARKLSAKQCKKLYLHEPFNVDAEIKADICKFCPLANTDCQGCSLSDSGTIVDGKILTELRWHVITYLNTLETVIAAWHMGIVDRQMIQEQFEFLNNPDKCYALSEFRHTAGGYPLIEEFIDEIKKPKAKEKKRLL